MAEPLTESFCERCGTRYEFTAPTRLNTLRKTRGLVSGLRNYLLTQDALSESIGDAMRSEEEELAAHQLQAFHAAFNFCIQCRQYACVNCWNEAEGRCRTCAPIAGRDDLAERMEAAYLADHAAMHAPPLDELDADAISRRLGVEAWPRSDLAEADGGDGHVDWPTEEPMPSLASVDSASPAPEPAAAREAAAEPLAEPEMPMLPVAWEPDVEPRPPVQPVAWEPDAQPATATASKHLPSVEPSIAEPWGPAEVVAERQPEVERLPEPPTVETPELFTAVGATPEPMTAAETTPETVAEQEAEPEPMLAEAMPEPEPMLAEATPEPEPMLAEATPEPEPMLAEATPEPEPMLAEAMPEPEPAVAESAPTPEPTRPVQPVPPPAPQPREPTPIRETFIRMPRPVPTQQRRPEPADELAVAARRAQLDVLGIDDPGVGEVLPERRVLPYRSSGAPAGQSELVHRTFGTTSALWDASAREVAAARSAVAVQNCGGCGLSLSASARFCRRCGTRQAQPA